MFSVRLRKQIKAICFSVGGLLVSVVLLVAGCLPLPAPSALSPLAPSPNIEGMLNLTVVHTNDTWGYLTPCG